MTIDPRHLANLLAVAKHGSFNRAAVARGLSQPALSNSIAQLERRLGVQVLDRSRRGSELNEFGKILVRSAEAVDSVLMQAREEVRLKLLSVDGPLRIGAAPSLMLKFMPDVMARLLKENPKVAISLVEGLDDQLLPELQAGDVDLVFGTVSSIFPAPKDIIEDALFEDPFSIGVGPDNPLSKRKSLTLAELRDHSWVLPRAGNAYRRHIEALFMTEGVPWPEDCVITSALPLVESILTQTDRVTFISEIQAAMHNTWRIRSIPLKGAGKRVLGIKWRRAGKLSELATSAVKIAHEVAHAYETGERRAKLRKR